MCGGDSGGPLLTTTADGSDVLLGVASFGALNCSAGAPMVFSRYGPSLSNDTMPKSCHSRIPEYIPFPVCGI